jgi:hypothetical protein
MDCEGFFVDGNGRGKRRSAQLDATPQGASLELSAPATWRPTDAAVRALARLLIGVAERQRREAAGPEPEAK